MVHKGTQRDAILYSVSANATHGLKRTNADKRKAVMTLLNDAEWAKWSDRQIAEKCGVSHEFVRGLRSPICQPLTDAPTERRTTRNGKTYTVETRLNTCRKVTGAIPWVLSLPVSSSCARMK